MNLNRSLPVELLESLKDAPGFDRKAFEQIHLSGEQVVSVRMNPLKLEKAPDFFSSENTLIHSSKIPWSSQGLYLSSRPNFTLDPLIHAGAYYVQEASSMFLEEAMRQHLDLSKPLRVLDLCAAPGGKSTLIQSVISPESLLVANELIKTRVNILEENMTKWGGVNTIITNNNPSAFSRLENYYDLIVVDAPCSGSGLFRREPEAITEWSTENVRSCSLRQQRILTDVWPALKGEGIMIYSTCSYSMEENEMILDKIAVDFEIESLRLKIPKTDHIVESISPVKKCFGYRFYPDKTKGEGLFMAVLQKKEGRSLTHSKSPKPSFDKMSRAEAEIVRPFLKKDDSLSLYKHNDLIFTLPSHLVNDLALIQKTLYLKKAGVVIGKAGAKELIPHHDLAMSVLVNDRISCVTLNQEDSIRYLRKDDFNVADAEKGWNIVRYQNVNLGWVKILDRRFNNYYPVEWRIRMNAY